MFGDRDVYATAGDGRIAEVAIDGDDVTVTVLGAGETVRIVGWSASPLAARTWAPSNGSVAATVSHDTPSGRWDLAVEIPPAGWARVHLYEQ